MVGWEVGGGGVITKIIAGIYCQGQKGVCEHVCRHMVTTGVEASLPHQNSTHRKYDGSWGGYQPGQMWSFFFYSQEGRKFTKDEDKQERGMM